MASLNKKRPPARTANKRTTNRPTTFAIGNKANRAGRPKGALNKIGIEVKEAVVNAAMNIGYDGKGEGGLIGYLEKMAKMEPKAFLGLLGRCIPINLIGKLDMTHSLLTREEVLSKLKERGIPVERIFTLPPPAVEKAEQPVETKPVGVVTIEGKAIVEQRPGTVVATVAKVFEGIAPPRQVAKVHPSPEKKDENE